jgi:STE24 endopeptidase
VFGFLSRRFERQADVFGCRVVSCGREACPPHADLNAAIEVAPAPDALCPVGIQIFSNALREVANLNGLSFQAPSWRHGSIARRISFLKGLVDRPDSVRLFQTQVARLRIILALVLLAATLLAIWMNQGGS